ncbi:hypothetical protein CLV56_3122 [Mumia flava]|uniref:Uncharacterized protein n=1 Tax=Mumia flava TaxID=1348852 RepID=A0A0B2BPF0_9ACTN|nr:hypothetical protein [Mumia flava]PJJ53631.1 hypothetical protein CLV56_3122 [Mumia flava]
MIVASAVRLVVCAALGAVGLVLAAGPAPATSCAEQTVGEGMDDVDAVFVATVTGTDVGVVTMEATDVYKGEVGPLVAVEEPGAMHATPPFETGQQYVVFADEGAGDDVFTLPLCSLTAPVDDALLAEVEASSSDYAAYRPTATAAPTTSRPGPTVEPTESAATQPVAATPPAAGDDSVGGSASMLALAGAVLAVGLVAAVPLLRRRRARA